MCSFTKIQQVVASKIVENSRKHQIQQTIYLF